MAPLGKPAVQLLSTDNETRSYFGGSPTAGSAIEWPRKNGKPLALLASLHLGELSTALELPWLPSDGRLLFFYDIDEQPWGFDPKDEESWAVIHVLDGSIQALPSQGTRSVPRRHMEFRSTRTYPSWERPEVENLRLNDKESEDLVDLCSASYGDAAAHQVAGFPNPAQSDQMDECQLESHGLYCGSLSGYGDLKSVELAKAGGDWKLLLQIDSDDGLDLMWGDLGTLYSWIREQDARSGNFDRAWLVVQCY